MLNTKQQMEIIKNFRAQTGYSLVDCKEVLEETQYDINKAKAILNAKYADKYQSYLDSDDTELAEYINQIFYNSVGDYGYVAFRSRSAELIQSKQLHDLMSHALDILDPELVDETQDLNYLMTNEGFKSSYEDILTYYREPLELVSINKRKLKSNEVLSSYSHNIFDKEEGSRTIIDARSSMVLVLEYENFLESSQIEKIRKLAHAIAMTTIGYNKAKVFYEHELDSKVITTFKDEKADDQRRSGKPEAAIAKIVEGQLKRFLSENLISLLPLMITLDLDWLSNSEDLTVSDAMRQTEKLLNTKLAVAYYKILSK